MEIVLLSLLTPFLGVALLLCDAQRQRAFPLQSRSFWTVVVRTLGVITALLGAGHVCLGALLVVFGSPLALLSTFPLQAGLGLVSILTGLMAFRVPRSWPRDEEDWDAEEVLDRCSPHSLYTEPQAAHLRCGAWVLVLYPLLFVLPMLVVGGMVLCLLSLIVLSAVIQSRRSMQSQLLWLLAIATRNRLPLPDELRSLGADRGVKLKHRFRDAAKDLEHGDPLWLALERHRLLPTAAIAAIRVSEGGARLEETLRRLAAQSTERLKVFNLSQLGEVLIQVFILLSVGVTVVSGVMYFIIPKFKQIFEGFEVELPGATRLLIDASDAVIYEKSALLFWGGLAITAMAWHGMRHLVGWSSLPFPVLMHWFPKRDAPEVLRALAGIARENASIPDKLKLLADRPGRPDLGGRYQRIADAVSEGELLSEALYEQGILTTLQREAVAAAECGGHLEFVLFSMAEAAEQREYRRGAFWAEMIKPVVVVGCGLVTAFVVVSLFLPLIKLLNELS